MCFTSLQKIAQTHICKFYTSRQNPANTYIQYFHEGDFETKSQNSNLLKTLLSRNACVDVLVGTVQHHFCLIQNKLLVFENKRKYTKM